MDSLEGKNLKSLYRSRLDEKLKSNNFNSTEEDYNYIEECIYTAARKQCNFTKEIKSKTSHIGWTKHNQVQKWES